MNALVPTSNAEAYRSVARRIGSRLRLDMDTACWIWTGAHNGQGYGRVWVHGKFKYVHRVTYEMVRGPIPAGLQLDHLCRNPSCASPAHLEPVTNAENTRRGAVSALRDRPEPTHCKRGHAYAERGKRDVKGHLGCRECTRLAGLARRRAAGKPQRKPYPIKGSSI